MRARYRAQGLVQGIGFRAWAQKRAAVLRLAGWIGNEEDGSVTGVAEGSREAMASFRELLGLGPEGAKVRRMQWDLDTDTEAGGESLPFPFEVRR